MALFNINKPGSLCPWQARRCISGRALRPRTTCARANARHFSLSNLNSSESPRTLPPHRSPSSGSRAVVRLRLRSSSQRRFRNIAKFRVILARAPSYPAPEFFHPTLQIVGSIFLSFFLSFSLFRRRNRASVEKSFVNRFYARSLHFKVQRERLVPTRPRRSGRIGALATSLEQYRSRVAEITSLFSQHPYDRYRIQTPLLI